MFEIGKIYSVRPFMTVVTKYSSAVKQEASMKCEGLINVIGRGSIPGRGKKFFSSPQRPDWGLTQTPIQWLPGGTAAGA
jgi:hypothetical protein